MNEGERTQDDLKGEAVQERKLPSEPKRKISFSELELKNFLASFADELELKKKQAKLKPKNIIEYYEDIEKELRNLKKIAQDKANEQASGFLLINAYNTLHKVNLSLTSIDERGVDLSKPKHTRLITYNQNNLGLLRQSILDIRSYLFLQGLMSGIGELPPGFFVGDKKGRFEEASKRLKEVRKVAPKSDKALIKGIKNELLR